MKKTSQPNGESDLHDLFVKQLKDILWAERKLLKVLPVMAKKAASPELKRAFEDHCKETEGHVSRLEKIFGLLGRAPRGAKCMAMEGLIAEGEELAEEYGDTVAVDAALIAAAQKVEHYEIATYGTLRTYAELLGFAGAPELLDATLQEEGNADKKLTAVAQKANTRANA
ncbi:MAG TPA: ferritin-like domain-containing protein [Verrucomicrobiales bacterium]|nr:ferritin-like domain-containing protein [Verrucomicrobiales bacterium]